MFSQSKDSVHLHIKSKQYLNFNSHHPYNIKKGIVRCLQHWAKAICRDSDVFQDELKSLRDNLHRNNYPESITPAPINLDWMTENNTRKLITICLPYDKGLSSKRLERYVVHMIWRPCSQVAWLFENISVESSLRQNTTWLRIASTSFHAVVVKY